METNAQELERRIEVLELLVYKLLVNQRMRYDERVALLKTLPKKKEKVGDE